MDSPVTPTILNSPIPDGDQYRERQVALFHNGLFAFVPVTMVRADDEVFPDLGRGSLRKVALAGEVWRSPRYVIEVEHDPSIEPDHANDSTYHHFTERIFARRPSLDTTGAGLAAPILELPADMDSDGNPIARPGMPTARYLALLKALIGGVGRRRAGEAQPARVPEGRSEAISPGARRGDVDWDGRVREFTADEDMGVWRDPRPISVGAGHDLQADA